MVSPIVIFSHMTIRKSLVAVIAYVWATNSVGTSLGYGIQNTDVDIVRDCSVRLFFGILPVLY